MSDRRQWAGLTEKQREANRLLGSGARHIMLYGGSRSGKTFLLCRAIAVRALKAPGSRHAIIRFRFNHVKTTIGYDTFPKMMELCFPGVRYKLEKTDWFFSFPGGSEVWLGGLDEKDRVEKILGAEYATIYLNECSQIKTYDAVETAETRLAQSTELANRMYYDCNPPGKAHWTYRLFIDKVRPHSKRDKLAEPDNYVSMMMNPPDNAANLPADYIESLGALSAEKRARFYLGLFQEAYDNALWTPELLDRTRVQLADVPFMQRVVVGVDPSGAKAEDDKRSDEIGIVVAGKGVDGRYYVLADRTLRGHPATWARMAVHCYREFDADAIIAENNFGGEMVVATIKNEDRNVPVYSRNAGARGKVVRAEPVAALWLEDKASLVGDRMNELEDQLTDMTTAGYMGQKSPDRADALVWALLELSGQAEPLQPRIRRLA